MQKDENNEAPIVSSIEELKKVDLSHLYVQAKCPQCGDTWLSLIPNAKHILENGCIVCYPKWTPGITILTSNKKR